MTIDREREIFRALLARKTLPAQTEAIVSEEPLVVVSAGAGTGKTWTLAWRFLWAVAMGRAQVGQILTLTFTDKAATEMAERIRSLMESVLMELPDEMATTRTFLKEGLSRLDEAYVSTIHSFASRVIRESGLSLAIDPSSRVVSSPEEDLFWRQMADGLDRLDGRWIGGNLSGDSRKRALSILEDDVTGELLSSYGPEAVVSFSKSLMDICASRGDSPKSLWEWADDIDTRHDRVATEILKAIHPLWEETYFLWLGPGGILPGVALDGTAFSDRLRGLVERWSTYEEDLDLPLFLEDLTETLKGARGKLAQNIGSLLPEGSVKAHRDSLLNRSFLWALSRSGWSQRELDLTSGLLRLAGICWLCWDSRKAGRGLIAFDDMLTMAGLALERNRAYSDRFREILVDEFQDTNGLQDGIIRSLADPGGSRLFLVGDLKQSIYRFRHADLSLFGRYISESRRVGGKYVSLDVSFRTRDLLLEKVNKLFSTIWKDGLGRSLPVGYEPLKPPVDSVWHGSRQGVSVPPCELLLVPLEEERISAEERRFRSVDMIARRLISMVGKEDVWDKDSEAVRKALWRDVAILVPTRTIFPAIQRVMGDLWGIPLHFEKNTSYYARTEVQDCVSLLRYLSDPEDELALAGFLCSPFSSVSLGEAHRILSEAEDGDLSDLVGRRHPDLMNRLDLLREIGRMKGASSVIEILGSDGSVLERFAEWKRRGVAANLRRTVDLLREYESTLGRGLSGAASWIGEALSRRAKEEEAGAVGPEENVVRVMTVHASKGLEFPVVVLAWCDGKGAGFPSSLLSSSHLGAALSKDDGEEEPLSRRVHEFLEEEAEREESERLFYVACTRARDCLILAGSENPPEGTWLSIVLDSGLALPTHGPEEGESPVRQGVTALPARGPVVMGGPPAGGLDRISPTSWALYRHCPYGWRLKFRQGMGLSWGYSDGDAMGGADLGTMAHWILARWNFSRSGLGKILSRDRSVVPPDIRHLWRDEDARGLVSDWLERLADSEEGERLRKLHEMGRLKREVPFRVPLDDGPMLVGSIDVMWEDGGEFFIRDYKTTASEAPSGLYEDQLRLYGLAVVLAFSPASVDMGLYRLREGCRVDGVSLNPFVDWQDLADRVRRDCLSAVSGPWDPSVDRCEGCPFAPSCLSR